MSKDNLVMIDEYERWAVALAIKLREDVEAGHISALAVVTLRPDGAPDSRLTLHHMAKEGEAHRLLGAVHELAWDITRDISEGADR